jgi:hypothetical protein
MSVLVWSMVGLAFWHFAVLVPDRFWGGIIGALVAAWAGALVSGYLLPEPGLPTRNPPGLGEALWAIPGSLLALAGSYRYGSRRERQDAAARESGRGPGARHSADERVPGRQHASHEHAASARDA